MKIQGTHIKTTSPTPSDNIAAGYNVGQWWEDTTTGEKFYHKSDGVWVLVVSILGPGDVSQYIRGDGTLGSFPDIAGGGGGQVYYFNGGISEGTIGTYSYYQMSTAANISTGVDFTSGTNSSYLVDFITEVGKPTQETIPAGVWIFQCYLSQSEIAGTPSINASVEVYNGATFSVLSTSLVEEITNGTSIDLYTFTVAVPEYSPLTTSDRITIRFFVDNLSGTNTVTLHTQGSHLSSVQTTFTTGISSLDGLTSTAQYFQIGSTGSDFNITTSGTDIHLFNLPTASATKRGALSSADWTTFNSKLGVTQVTPITLATGGWTFSGGLYEYTYSNVNILSTSIVDIIPSNASITIVRDADILPANLSAAGTVTMYSTNLPTGNITVSINIYN
jgi:hypothetical protein